MSKVKLELPSEGMASLLRKRVSERVAGEI
jgi:hypothetical protein